MQPKLRLASGVFQVSQPYLGFRPDPKHFILNCEENVVKFAGKWGKICWKMQFLYKIFWTKKKKKERKKSYADRPYLVFSELKPEIHTFIFGLFTSITNTDITVKM